MSTVTDRDRRDVFNSFEAAYGEDIANTIMQLLPSQPADQLVTRTDMHVFGDALRADIKGEMADLRGELRSEMAELRGELRSEMADLRGELRNDMADLRGELRSEMIDRFAVAKVETQRLIAASMAGNTIAVVTALLL